MNNPFLSLVAFLGYICLASAAFCTHYLGSSEVVPFAVIGTTIISAIVFERFVNQSMKYIRVNFRLLFRALKRWYYHSPKNWTEQFHYPNNYIDQTYPAKNIAIIGLMQIFTVLIGASTKPMFKGLGADDSMIIKIVFDYWYLLMFYPFIWCFITSYFLLHSSREWTVKTISLVTGLGFTGAILYAFFKPILPCSC